MQSNSSSNCIHLYNNEILNIDDPELQMINTKPITKNKLNKFSKWFGRVESSDNISLRL